MKRSILSVLLVFASSFFGVSVVFPIFAPLFLSRDEISFVGDIPEHLRAIFLGLFLAAYPMAQFFSAPIIGAFADHKGRKLVFSITLLMEAVGFAITALAIQWHFLTLVFIGRFITGFAAGYMAICLAAIADSYPNAETRNPYYSYGSAAAGVMFVIGPFLGGRFTKLFSPAFSMWVGMGVSLLNLMSICLLFQETLHKKRQSTFNPLNNISLAFKESSIKILYLGYFFFLIAWNIIYQFMPAFMVQEFNSTTRFIGDVSALMGLVWIIGTLSIPLLMYLFHINAKLVLLTSFFMFSLATLFTTMLENVSFFLCALAVSVFFVGGIWPMFLSLISQNFVSSTQGKMMGLTQSIQSLTMMLAPILGGLLFQVQLFMPFMVSAMSTLIAAALLATLSYRRFS